MDDLWVVLPHIGAGGAQKVGLLAAGILRFRDSRCGCSLRHGHPIKHAIPDSGARIWDRRVNLISILC